MIIRDKQEFIDLVRSFDLTTAYAVVKPNWVSNTPGNYTEPEILDWLFEALPREQKKIVVESYTPWRGMEYQGGTLGVGLEDGKQHADFYRAMDASYLESTGIGAVIDRYGAEYVNITNEYWQGTMVDPNVIGRLVAERYGELVWKELYGFVPHKLFDLREDATFISLAKIKAETDNPAIMVSLASKNLFGLLPHPSRLEPYHRDNHVHVPQVLFDINKVWLALFNKPLFINEGIKSLVRHYCDPSESHEYNNNLLFAGTDPVATDRETCEAMGVVPDSVPYFKLAGTTFAV